MGSILTTNLLRLIYLQEYDAKIPPGQDDSSQFMVIHYYCVNVCDTKEIGTDYLMNTKIIYNKILLKQDQFIRKFRKITKDIKTQPQPPIIPKLYFLRNWFAQGSYKRHTNIRQFTSFFERVFFRLNCLDNSSALSFGGGNNGVHKKKNFFFLSLMKHLSRSFLY
ncbi:hypothetical protein RIR_jg19684.t1 [Rhizophagus irregularis DAOM 181602=DAOM 197198]|nr:hypothetical protein RIR_jg19684.t1 [Rhizophagus irregularis DAOM 181602=DAOM 197198]